MKSKEKKARSRYVRIPSSIEDVPREGMLFRRDLEVIFGKCWRTIKAWQATGIIPEPINNRAEFKGCFHEKSANMWRAEDVWDAYEQFRKTVQTQIGGNAA